MIVKRLHVVHDNQSLWLSLPIWRSRLRNSNQRFLQKPYSDSETSQCCPWKQNNLWSSVLIWTLFASKLKPPCSATTIVLYWNFSMLCMTTKVYDNRYWFEEVCFEPGTTVFCSIMFLTVKLLNVVQDSKHLRSSVLLCKSQLRLGNHRFLQQPFSDCEASQCCP